MPLRIAVCSGQIPFVRGGSEILTDALVEQLQARGHAVETVRIPLRWYPKEQILKGYLAWRLIDLEESEGEPIDRVIALKFPAFVVPHSHKTTWLVQQFRQAYDLYGTPHSHLGGAEGDDELRLAIRDMDRVGIAESEKVFAISNNVGRRLAQYNGVDSQTLYPPPAMDGQYRHVCYGDYVLSLSRLNVLKRVDKLIEAMARTSTGVRCLIAGRGQERERLERLATQRGVADRVRFLGFVEDREALDLYANALCVYYAPYDEDYGLATVEAGKSRKPVLTADDSGGVLEFVRDGETGIVFPAKDTDALAESIDVLYSDRDRAARLGSRASEVVCDITWDRTIDTLLGG